LYVENDAKKGCTEHFLQPHGTVSELACFLNEIEVKQYQETFSFCAATKIELQEEDCFYQLPEIVQYKAIPGGGTKICKI
jgi:hypothetical protein